MNRFEQNQKQNLKQGYFIVCPDIVTPVWYGLDVETLTRCLSYLIKHLDRFGPIPDGLSFGIGPAQYMGQSWPGIAMFRETNTSTTQQLNWLTFDLEDRMNAYIQDIGVDKLVELSAGETMSWAKVLEELKEEGIL